MNYFSFELIYFCIISPKNVLFIPTHSLIHIFSIYIPLYNSASFKVCNEVRIFSSWLFFLRFHVSVTAGSAFDIYFESPAGCLFQDRAWLDADRH